MTIQEDHLLTLGAAHGRDGIKIVPEGVVVHYVGNPGSTAIANRNYFENGAGGTDASAHYIVGLQGEIIRCIPEDEKANHAGKAYGNFKSEQTAQNNKKYIGIENCHPAADGKFNDDTYNALVELVVDICKRYGFGVDKVYRHYDVCGKLCPAYYVANPTAWDRFVSDVHAKL